MEFLSLILAGITGGLIGGSIAFILGKKHGNARAGFSFHQKLPTVADQRPAVVIKFPPKVIKFSKN